MLAVAVLGRGLVSPEEPILYANDLSLLRGLAAFETVRVYGGQPFRLDEHLGRLAASARRIGIPSVSAEELESLAATALAAAELPDCVLRFYWTGGREGTGVPTALAMVSTLPEQLDTLRRSGVHAISLQLGLDPTSRAAAPWLLGGVKSTSYAVNMAAEEEARRRGAEDAVFLASDGTVLEGPVTNVWWRDGETLCTPALELGILAGVTRGYILGAAGALGFRIDEGRYPIERLATAEEAFTLLNGSRDHADRRAGWGRDRRRPARQSSRGAPARAPGGSLRVRASQPLDDRRDLLAHPEELGFGASHCPVRSPASSRFGLCPPCVASSRLVSLDLAGTPRCWPATYDLAGCPSGSPTDARPQLRRTPWWRRASLSRLAQACGCSSAGGTRRTRHSLRPRF